MGIYDNERSVVEMVLTNNCIAITTMTSASSTIATTAAATSATISSTIATSRCTSIEIQETLRKGT